MNEARMKAEIDQLRAERDRFAAALVDVSQGCYEAATGRIRLDGHIVLDRQYVIDHVQALADRRNDLLAACELAVRELNEIRARDGVPYTHLGFKSSVTEEHFSAVVDTCFRAIAKAKGAA